MNKSNFFSKKYARFVSSNPLWVLTVIFALLVFSTFSLPNFKLDASSDSLVLENDDDLKYYRQINSDYASSDFLVVLFKPKEELFSKQSISVVRSLSDDLEGIVGVSSVLSYLDAPLLFSPKLSITELADNLKTIEDESIDLVLAKEEFKTSALYSELLSSKDGKITALQVSLDATPLYDKAVADRYEIINSIEGSSTSNSTLDQALRDINLKIQYLNDQETFKRDELVRSIRSLLQDYKKHGSIYLGGTAMIASDMVSFIKSDLLYFGLGVLTMFILTLGIVFRKVRWVALPLGCSFFVALFAVGFFGWMDWRVTVVSSNFISLLLIITISLTIHLIVRYQELAAKDTLSTQRVLIKNTVEQMLKPCLYTALTTMIAFASLAVSDIKPVIDFGQMMVTGILFAFLFAFTILPSVMSLMERTPSNEKDFSKGLTLYFSSFTENNGRTILILTGLLVVVAFSGISKLNVENRFIDYFKTSTEIYKGMEILDTQLGGTAPLDVILEAPIDFSRAEQEEEFDDFSFEDSTSNGYWWNTISIKRLEAVHDYLNDLPEIGKVLSIASGIKVAEELNDGEPLSELDLALVKNMLPDDIKETLLNSYISKDENQVRISARVLESTEGLNRNELLENISNTLEGKFNFKEDEYRLTGLAVLYNNMLQSLFSSLVGTLGIVFGVISLMFLILFRSFSLTAIGMVPNLLAAGVVLGSMGWLSIPLDIMTITVAAISVGMAVDNTIHYIFRFKLEFEETGNYRQSMLNSHRTIGRAMFYTSMTIILGFMVFMTSNFIPSVYFGFFVSLAMIMALLGALTLLPQLLLTFKPFGKESNY
jgi:predicted RND superfamily exporter protein